MSRPGDLYEREADRVADQVLRQDVSKEEQIQNVQNPPKGSSGDRDINVDWGNRLDDNKGGGTALPDDVRAYMEPRMRYKFGNVRIHTDSDSSLITKRLGARALTHGNNIYFATGQYNPSNNTGRRLIAHELVHVMQQSGTPPASLQLTPAPANLVSGAWTSLGSFSWDHHMYREPRRVVLNVMVGSRSDWEARLRNLDDSDEIWQAKGFMETASNPALVNRSRPLNPWRARNYQNNVRRAPNETEILDFLLALYNLGKNLDLANDTFEEGGLTRRYFRSNLNEIVSRYQGRLLQKTTERREVISQSGITGLVGQTGRGTVIAVIQNAAATAMKAVDLIASAKQSGDSDALSDAQALIRNSGRTINHALKAHDANVAFNNSVAQGVFDVVWSTLPGGGALVSAGMEILKLGFKKMLEEAAKDDEPATLAENIKVQFIAHVRQARRAGHLGSGNEGVYVESDAINGFEATIR